MGQGPHLLKKKLSLCTDYVFSWNKSKLLLLDVFTACARIIFLCFYLINYICVYTLSMNSIMKPLMRLWMPYRMMVLLWYTVVCMMSSCQSANLLQLLEQVYVYFKKIE